MTKKATTGNRQNLTTFMALGWGCGPNILPPTRELVAPFRVPTRFALLRRAPQPSSAGTARLSE